MQHRKLIADENIDERMIARLRSEGIGVLLIAENHRGIADSQVIELAQREKSIILTRDSDFGEWVFAHGK